MARLIPKIDVSDIANNGERLVASALTEQLPDECIIYHSYPWLRPERNAYNSHSTRTSLHQGEADFIIVHPTAGFLILEVKGGEIDYDHNSREWVRLIRDRRDRITDPFKQANRNTHALVDRIQGKDKYFPCPYGFAVVFPHCDYTGGVPPGADSKLVFSSRDMSRLGSRVKNALEAWSRSSRPVEISKQEMEKIQLGLSPAMKLTPVLYRKLDDQNERLHRLTNGQLQLLEGLQEHTRAAIKGVAGSGKTILANVKAQEFAREGKRTLFVCYNRLLAESLEANLPDSLIGMITYTSFHSLCAQWCRKAKISFNPPSDNSDEFWRIDAPDKLNDAIELLGDRFNAVVVDEGQDFMPNWWMSLELINQEEERGPFYVFYDPEQNLFDTKTNMPDLGTNFTLPVNCRNTRMIAELCGQVTGVKIRLREETPNGDEVVIETITDPNKRQNFIVNTVDAWLRKGQLKPSRIVIQSLNDKTRTSLSGIDKIGRVPIVQDQQKWRNNEGVLFATVRAFKGLEADAVILIDVPNVNANKFFSKADLYVGCSRAKHVLVIVAKEKLFSD